MNQKESLKIKLEELEQAARGIEIMIEKLQDRIAEIRKLVLK